MASDTFDSVSLIRWFEEKKRKLPWREDPNPYQVWVSEIMLQQTQSLVVIPYYKKWMQRFPNVEALASASLDEVIKMWEGLGYYSRARNLLVGAKTICEKYNGELPESQSALSKIKGLGPYTIGAIRSFAFHKKTAAVDGNVLRVISRYFEIEDDIAKSATKSKMHDIIEDFLPDDKHWIVNEALIELGATLCKKKPQCTHCPLARSCKSFRNGTTHKIPIKSTKTTTIALHRTVAVIVYENVFLVRRCQKGEVMQDLHEFPYFENSLTDSTLAEEILNTHQMIAKVQKKLHSVIHTFTKYRVTLDPFLVSVCNRVKIPGYVWKTKEELMQLAFSSGHRKVLKGVLFDSPRIV